MLEHIVAICMLVSIVLYALTGGADFGGGLWDLLASGPRAKQQRNAIEHAIGPIWEANHVWLILVVVILFTGFPKAFAAMMTALNIPVTAMLIGIVLRGSAFIFRKYDSKAGKIQRGWGMVFGTSSVITPLVQGTILGALATGRIRIVNGQVVTGFFAGWMSTFALGCGLFALGLFAFLAATYLTVETKDQPELQNDFRRRAMGAGLALVPLAAAVWFISSRDAPSLFHELTQWWALVLFACTACLAAAALVALGKRRFILARIAAVGQVTLILAGWSIGQYPHIIIPDVTFLNAQAPQITLRLLLTALGAGALVLFPSLFFLFHLFKGQSSQ